MEISGMLIWATVLVSLIVFIVLLVKAFKSWGVVHTILLTILFIEAWTFLFFVGGVAHYRIVYTKLHDTLAEKVDEAEWKLAMQQQAQQRDAAMQAGEPAVEWHEMRDWLQRRLAEATKPKRRR